MTDERPSQNASGFWDEAVDLLTKVRDLDLHARPDFLSPFLDLAARLDRPQQDALGKLGAKIFHYRTSTFRQELATRAATRQAAEATAAVGNAEQRSQEEIEQRRADLQDAAAPILASADPVPLVEQAICKLGYGGDVGPAMLVYLATTTRVLAMRTGTMPTHVVLLGIPSAGKSYTLKLVCALLPPEAWHVIEAGSPRALIYDAAPLKHRVLVFGESDSLPAGEDNPAASAVRTLLQEHQLRYSVVVRDPDDHKFRLQEVVKPGPTVLITTAIQRLGPQLDSRLFGLEVPEDVARIRAALATQARIELTGVGEADPALVAFQGYLQTLAPIDVIVPFAEPLASDLGRATASPRVLRDFQRLLSLIKATAVLRLAHRRRDDTGRLIAELDDYASVRELIGDMYEGSATGASDNVRQVVAAVARLTRGDGLGACTTTQVAQTLAIPVMAAWRWVQAAVKGGWVVNLEDRERRPARLVLGEALPPRGALPEPEALAASWPRRSPVV